MNKVLSSESFIQTDQ